jgi:aryl-alcohol dehydrogenase-like predicted oxidoreductase
MTSQLGFGCAFPPTTTEQQAAYLLAAAYDAGIRHFDVAPFYLDGKGEAYLGNFLARHPEATVTTKYGLLPPSGRPLHIRVARSVLGPAFHLIRNKLRGGSENQFGAVPLTAKASFRPGDMVKSLDRSRSLLKRPYIDLFLFHEANLSDLGSESLLHSVLKQVSLKSIGSFGVGGEIDRVLSVFRGSKAFCNVMQFNWDATADLPPLVEAFQIFFRVLSRDLHGLRRTFKQDRSLADRWSYAIGLDLRDDRNVADVMLKSSLVANPSGITLIRSSNADNILHNVAVAGNSSLEKSALLFLSMTMSELSGRKVEPSE